MPAIVIHSGYARDVDPNALEILPLTRTSMQTVTCASRGDPVACLAAVTPSFVRSIVGRFEICVSAFVLERGCVPPRVIRELNAFKRSCCLLMMVWSTRPCSISSADENALN